MVAPPTIPKFTKDHPRESSALEVTHFRIQMKPDLPPQRQGVRIRSPWILYMMDYSGLSKNRVPPRLVVSRLVGTTMRIKGYNYWMGSRYDQSWTNPFTLDFFGGFPRINGYYWMLSHGQTTQNPSFFHMEVLHKANSKPSRGETRSPCGGPYCGPSEKRCLPKHFGLRVKQFTINGLRGI